MHHKDGVEYLSEKTLLIVIDDTGQENFKDPNFKVFGLGGCAFLVRDYQRLIEKPWNEMCQRYFPEVKRPMHAADLRKPSTAQLDGKRPAASSHKRSKIESC